MPLRLGTRRQESECTFPVVSVVVLVGQVVVAGWRVPQPVALVPRHLLLLLLLLRLPLLLQLLLLLQVWPLATLDSRAATSVATGNRTLSSHSSADHWWAMAGGLPPFDALSTRC